jgi:hypothetical protein
MQGKERKSSDLRGLKRDRCAQNRGDTRPGGSGTRWTLKNGGRSNDESGTRRSVDRGVQEVNYHNHEDSIRKAAYATAVPATEPSETALAARDALEELGRRMMIG